jgi:predicted esterase
MQKITITISLVSLVFGCPIIEAREWVNLDGQKIQADYVRANEVDVTLKMNAKEIQYPIQKLSEKDQQFIKDQLSAPAIANPSNFTKGWIDDFPIKPSYNDPQAYLTHKNTKAVYRAFADGEYPKEWSSGKRDAKTEFAYDESKATAYVYVPSGYDATKPYGIYLHISSVDQGAKCSSYAPVMERLQLIYVGAKGASNDQPMLRRIRLSFDAVQSVIATHKIDLKRVSVGGLSGGGHMAMLTHAMFPETFMGSVSHAAQSYLPTGSSVGHFPGLEIGDLKSGVLKDHKWCVISGDRDKNYGEIKTTSELWEKERLNYRFIDVAGMGHASASADSLEEALKWLYSPPTEK